MENKERNITPEEAVILWHASRLDLSEDYEQAPEILKVQGSVIGTLGNFSASIGKAKSKKTFNVSAIVAAALKKRDGTELYGRTARKQAENTLCGHRTELLSLCESGKAQPAHGGTADRQQP